MSTKGSCLCGKVSFEIEGDFEHFFLCHCSYCQKDTGSAHAATLFANKARLTWVSGEEWVTRFNLPATRHVKSFCAHCGSALPTMITEADLLMVPAGSLDEPVRIAPSAHLFVGSRANWDHDLEKVQTFAGLPQQE